MTKAREKMTKARAKEKEKIRHRHIAHCTLHQNRVEDIKIQRCSEFFRCIVVSLFQFEGATWYSGKRCYRPTEPYELFLGVPTRCEIFDFEKFASLPLGKPNPRH